MILVVQLLSLELEREGRSHELSIGVALSSISTMQAEGYSSDCYLKPVRIYNSMIKNDEQYPLFYVLCEVYDKNNKPHETNQRFKLGKEDSDF